MKNRSLETIPLFSTSLVIHAWSKNAPIYLHVCICMSHIVCVLGCACVRTHMGVHVSISSCMYLPSDGFLIIPPMASVENQHVGILPFEGHPIYDIQLECSLYFFPHSGWGTALDHQEWAPIILYSAIVVLKHENQKARVLCDRLAIYFIDWALVKNSRRKHAEERLPLVSANGVPHKHQTSVP